MKKSLTLLLAAVSAAAVSAAPVIPKAINDHKLSDGNEIAVDITQFVTEPATLEFKIAKAGGANAVAINSVAITENDQQLAVDAHRGTSGMLQTNNAYLISIPEIKSGAVYKMIAKIEPIGEGKTDCLVRTIMTKMPLMKQIGTWDKDVIIDGGEDDITQLVPKSGKFQVLYRYTHGPHAADIVAASILEDGKEIAKDQHPGKTGYASSNNAYKFAIPYKEGAKYTLVTEFKTKNDKGGAVNSNGLIWISEDK